MGGRAEKEVQGVPRNMDSKKINPKEKKM